MPLEGLAGTRWCRLREYLYGSAGGGRGGVAGQLRAWGWLQHPRRQGCVGKG
jgi:hypothetical protein